MYPSLKQVDTASREQLAKWYRFLPSPGMSALGKENFNEILADELEIMEHLIERFKTLGGFSPEISKSIGWRD